MEVKHLSPAYVGVYTIAITDTVALLIAVAVVKALSSSSEATGQGPQLIRVGVTSL